MRASCGNGQPLPREAAGRNNVISDQAILIDRVVQMAQTKLTSGRSLISHPGLTVPSPRERRRQFSLEFQIVRLRLEIESIEIVLK
jgi:hypothetical protein